MSYTKVDVMSGLTFGKALAKAGIIPANTSRAIIDVNPTRPVRIYVEFLGGERLLDVVPALRDCGFEIVGAAPAAQDCPEAQEITAIAAFSIFWHSVTGLSGEGFKDAWTALPDRDKLAWRAVSKIWV